MKQAPHWNMLMLLALMCRAGAAQEEAETEPPEVLKISLAQACVLGVENGRLIADSVLQGVRLADQPVIVEGLGGRGTLMLRPFNLRFENAMSTDDYGAVQMLVESGRRGVRVEWNCQQWSMYLRQSSSRRGDDFGESDISLSVYGADGTLKHSLRGDNFAQLLKNHPAEVYQFIGPVFRALRTKDLLGVEESLARVVVAPKREAEEIEANIARLDSDSGLEREEASAELRKAGVWALAVIEKLDRKKLTLQQRIELDAIMQEIGTISAEEAQRLRGDAGFVLDCFYSEAKETREGAVKVLKELMGMEVMLDPARDSLAQAEAVEGLRKAVGAKETGSSRGKGT